MPLYRRLPKRGFVPHGGGGIDYAVVNLKSLGGFAANAVVDPDSLVRSGLIKASGRSRVKILGDGEVAHALTIRAHRVSESARSKIEAKGGRVETLGAEVPAS
jgi:large subunit ribosomal protein L15